MMEVLNFMRQMEETLMVEEIQVVEMVVLLEQAGLVATVVALQVVVD